MTEQILLPVLAALTYALGILFAVAMWNESAYLRKVYGHRAGNALSVTATMLVPFTGVGTVMLTMW